MITKIRLPQTLIPVSIVAITMLAAVLLFPAVNSASSEPGKQAPSKQSKNHNRLINESKAGRVFEIDVQGDIVWEYVKPFDAEYAALIEDAIRFEKDYLEVQDWSCP